MSFLLALAACSAERDPAALDAQVAQAFYARNHDANLAAFDGLTVRVTRPVTQRDVTVLGHVYAISFCTEVVDVNGNRGTTDFTFNYSDWPPTQHDLMRRARRDSVGRAQLAALFKVPAAVARTTFATWAAQTVTEFKQLNPPPAPGTAGGEILTLRACVSQEGHPVLLTLGSGLEILHLPPDTENSVYWTKARRQFQRLGPSWYWRRPPATELAEDNPIGL